MGLRLLSALFSMEFLYSPFQILEGFPPFSLCYHIYFLTVFLSSVCVLFFPFLLSRRTPSMSRLSHSSFYLTPGPTLLPSYIFLGFLFSHLQTPAPCHPRPSSVTCVSISAHKEEGWCASLFISILLALSPGPGAMKCLGYSDYC